MSLFRSLSVHFRMLWKFMLSIQMALFRGQRGNAVSNEGELQKETKEELNCCAHWVRWIAVPTGLECTIHFMVHYSVFKGKMQWQWRYDNDIVYWCGQMLLVLPHVCCGITLLQMDSSLNWCDKTEASGSEPLICMAKRLLSGHHLYSGICSSCSLAPSCCEPECSLFSMTVLQVY